MILQNPLANSPSQDNGLEVSEITIALQRLTRALNQLEERLLKTLSGHKETASARNEEKLLQLTAELEAVRTRERALELVAEEASAALGRAAEAVQLALRSEFPAIAASQINKKNSSEGS